MDDSAIVIHVVRDHHVVAVSEERDEEMGADLGERMTKTYDRLTADYSMLNSKIRRFPQGLRGIGGHAGRYIVPSLVAVGPYHHGAPHLREMEEVKLAAAYHLCTHSTTTTTVDAVYRKIVSVAAAARRCYDADDPAVAGLSDADFAAMMFVDGCFLMEYMDGKITAPFFENRVTLSTGPSVLKDIFLLENQIPWLVLDALMEFMPVALEKQNPNGRVRGVVAGLGDRFFRKKTKERCSWPCPWPSCFELPEESEADESCRRRIYEASYTYTPSHLLGLLRHTLIRSMPADEVNYRGISSSLSYSAVELAQMGVVLSPSTEPWFGDMTVHRGTLIGSMSLSPVVLNEVTACWLVNMAALEASTAASPEKDGFVVSSFLSVFAMLMARKEDVHELRGKRLLESNLSNAQTLGFFKGLGQNLGFGGRYFAVMEQIDAYKRHNPVRIAAYKLVYNHYKSIAAVLSIAGVLVGIFKALLSLKCTSSSH